VAAGDWAVVTVDSKGRVTAGRALTAADVPSLPGSKINSELSVDTTGNAATATALQTERAINGVNFDGTQDITINAVDATPRIASSEKGQANGVATLDNDGKVPSSQLPSYVDDVIEVATFDDLPDPGEPSKIYVTTDNNKTYRWTGTQYIAIPGGVGLADAALKLNTPRKIESTGDVTWEVTFDGSTPVSGAAALSATGVTAGDWAVVTVDLKGRVTAGRDLTADDIPTLDYTKVTSAASLHLAESAW
jgi:phage-related tail fiber protein